jgi:hypothetical protein
MSVPLVPEAAGEADFKEVNHEKSIGRYCDFYCYYY